LFETRDVEPPSEQRSTFTQPTSPDIVLSNITFAIAEKNLDNYMRCFTDTNFSPRVFKFFPDANSQVNYPIFLTWNLNSERIYYSNLIISTNASTTSNLFSDNIIFNNAIDSAIIDLDYILVYNHNRENVTKQAKGKLRFIMGTDSRSLWSIHTWYDFLDASNDTTWSVVKANFVN